MSAVPTMSKPLDRTSNSETTPAWIYGAGPELDETTGPAPATTPAPSTPSTTSEQILVHRSRALPGVELWSIRNSSRPWSVLQSTFTFGIAERVPGELHWRSGGRSAPLTPATTMLVEPDELQTTVRTAGPADLDFLLVSTAAVQREFDRDLFDFDDDRPHHFGHSRLEDLALVSQFRRVWRSMFDPHANEVEQQVLFRAYLHAVFERAGVRGRTTLTTRCDQALEQVRTTIHKRFAERLTLDGFASETNFSKFYLERSFHERFGLPIHQYLKKVRISRALDLLRQGVRPSVVSRKVGFADQPHMTRVFRDELGVTPRKFWNATSGG